MGVYQPVHPSSSVPQVRLATAADAPGIARTLGLAFENDPLWSWALPGGGRGQRLERLWRHYVDNALHYQWTFTSGEYEAACVWIPPERRSFRRKVRPS